MTEAERIWSGKSDEQLADAATKLAEFTEEGEQVIRAELRRRGMTDPDPIDRPSVGPRSPVIHRYQDGYRVGGTLVGAGNALKVIGAIVGGLILVASFFAVDGPLGGGAVVAGAFLATLCGASLWVAGVLIAAQGQILQASLDTAVAQSPFLTDSERLEAMGLSLDVSMPPL